MFNGKILVVVDMQNDFISGPLGSAAALTTILPVQEKIVKAQKEGTHIFVTMDTHTENYLDTLEGQKLPVEHCIQYTEGWELHPVINGALDGGSVVLKHTFGAMNLPKIIVQDLDIPGDEGKVKEIEICGLCTDICVMNNMAILRAAFPNAIIKVDHRACAGTSAAAHDAALLVMKSLQVDVI